MGVGEEENTGRRTTKCVRRKRRRKSKAKAVSFVEKSKIMTPYIFYL